MPAAAAPLGVQIGRVDPDLPHDAAPGNAVAVAAAREVPRDRSDPAFTPDPALLRYLKALQESARAHTLAKATTIVPDVQREILRALGYGK